MTGTPPAYLHEPEEMLAPFAPVALPRGSRIVVRGTTVHAGRQLKICTDGRNEVDFVNDGADGVVAHFPLTDDARLRVVAAFGDVRVPQADIELVTSIADERPRVKLEGAPRTVRILDEPTIQLTYEASDNHGLREVVLALRTGDAGGVAHPLQAGDGRAPRQGQLPAQRERSVLHQDVRARRGARRGARQRRGERAEMGQERGDHRRAAAGRRARGAALRGAHQGARSARGSA